MKCNLIINTAFVRVYVDNKSNWVSIGKKYFAKANSVCTIPLVFLSGSDSTCVSSSIGTISENILSVPTGTSDIHLTITNAKAKVAFNNSTGGRVIGISGPAFATMGQPAQYTMAFANGYSGDMLVSQEATISGNSLTVTVADNPNVDVSINYMQTAELTIGTSTSSNDSLPFNYYYKYSMSQQIYTASELNAASFNTISSISLYALGNVSNRKLKIYLENTDTTQFSGTKFIQINTNTLVYSGTVSFSGNQWTTINFSTPFKYIAGKSILVTIVDATGSYKTSVHFKVYNSDTTQAAFQYNDSIAYNPALSDNTATFATSKNSVKLMVSNEPDYEMINGTKYRVVTIGSQTWMAENLSEPYGGATYYNDNEVEYGRNGKNHGLLYTWSEANALVDSIPGWHLPTQDEWRTLFNTVGINDAGKKLTANYGWENVSMRTDDYGFSILPAGTFDIPSGEYRSGDSNGYYRTATTFPDADDVAYTIFFNPGAGIADYFADNKENKRIAIRLVKDA